MSDISRSSHFVDGCHGWRKPNKWSQDREVKRKKLKLRMRDKLHFVVWCIILFTWLDFTVSDSITLSLSIFSYTEHLCLYSHQTVSLSHTHTNWLSHTPLGSINARDDKQRQFAYRAAVAESVAKIGLAFGKTVGKSLYPSLQCEDLDCSYRAMTRIGIGLKSSPMNYNY